MPSNKPTQPTAIVRQFRQLSPGFRALFASFAFFVIVAALVYPHFPSRTASHFNASGRPDGYLSPAANLTMLVFACIVFVFIFGLLHFGIRQSDPKNLNLPDTARWKDRAERVALRDNLADSMLWLAAASVTFMALVFFSLYRANQPWSGGLGAEFWIGLAAYAGLCLFGRGFRCARFSRRTLRSSSPTTRVLTPFRKAAVGNVAFFETLP